MGEEFDWKRLLKQYELVKKKEFAVIQQIKALRQDALDNWPEGAKEIVGDGVRLSRYEGFRNWKFSDGLQKAIDTEKANGTATKETIPFIAFQAGSEADGWKTYYRFLKDNV